MTTTCIFILNTYIFFDYTSNLHINVCGLNILHAHKQNINTCSRDCICAERTDRTIVIILVVYTTYNIFIYIETRT